MAQHTAHHWAHEHPGLRPGACPVEKIAMETNTLKQGGGTAAGGAAGDGAAAGAWVGVAAAAAACKV